MNKKLLVIVAVLAGIGLFAGGFFFSQVNAQANQPGWMMGNWNSQANGNMMGMMMSGSMMGGQYGSGMMDSNMMRHSGYAPDAEINVTAAEAVDTAQEYLDGNLPGKTADDEIVALPGYYTLHILEDGEVVGMLSVNAYTGQVFLHHWHGEFVGMAGADHE